MTNKLFIFTLLILLSLSQNILKAQDSLPEPNTANLEVKNGKDIKSDSHSKLISFKDNSAYLSFGIGFPNLYQKVLLDKIDNANKDLHKNYYSLQNAYSFSVSSILLREVKLEMALNKNLGMQFTGSYFQINAQELHTYFVPPPTGTVNIKYSDTTTVSYNSLTLGLRFNFHYSISPYIDLYSGFGTGLSLDEFNVRFGSRNPIFTSSSLNTQHLTPAPFNISATTGARLYISRLVAWYLEAGYDKWAVLHTGIVIKFQP